VKDGLMAKLDIVKNVLDFIAADSADDEAFNDLALKLFAYQFRNNDPFMKFARRRGATPRTVKSWTDIPAVPINAFKTLDLSCSPITEAKAVFMTSGTTQGGVRGKSYHPTLDVYDASMHRNFRDRFMGNFERIKMGILFPAPAIMPNSSLAHYLDLAVRDFGLRESCHLVDVDGINYSRLFYALNQAEQTNEAYALLGASFSLVHVLDEMERTHRKVKLPAGSRILDTGGFKGQSRELEPNEFYDKLEDVFGVPRSLCINMYGMTELSSQFYDDGNLICPSVKYGPHWLRTRVVNPITGENLPDGQIGILAHTDLAHFNICTTILTEDAGLAVKNGFQLIGRADGIEAQGCSMAVDEFLKAAASS
tara:strand:+ start:1534 stop:2631 length:1098 start_codon:yes stop_codon:yes gene_type:complete